LEFNRKLKVQRATLQSCIKHHCKWLCETEIQLCHETIFTDSGEYIYT